MHHRPLSRSCAGFTLIETTLALFLIAAGMIGLFSYLRIASSDKLDTAARRAAVAAVHARALRFAEGSIHPNAIRGSKQATVIPTVPTVTEIPGGYSVDTWKETLRVAADGQSVEIAIECTLPSSRPDTASMVTAHMVRYR